MADKLHPIIKHAGREFADGKLDRREFLRVVTLLGIAAPVAFGMAGLSIPAKAQGTPKKGGTLRLGSRVQDLKSPHTYSWVEAANAGRQTLDYLTYTGIDNITRPNLVEKWEASPDLKSWTLRLRKDVTWRKGNRKLTADDVAWNIKRVLDAKTGSSVVGLLRGFILDEFETGEKDDKGVAKKSTRLWDANAIERVDDFTVRLNGKTANLSIPEALFHYPFLIMDPEENGEFKVGSNGTGAFEMVELDVGKRAKFVARKSGHWGGGAHIDIFEIIDLGDDAAAQVAALASKQVDMIYQGAITTYSTIERVPHVQINIVDTAYTAVARVHSIKPFDDKRVRQALAWALNRDEVTQVAFFGQAETATEAIYDGNPYYSGINLYEGGPDPEGAMALLAEAGVEGLSFVFDGQPQVPTQVKAAQVLQQQLRAAGITMDIQNYESGEWITRLLTKEYTATISYWSATLDPAHFYLPGLLSTSGWNISGFGSPEMDEALNAFATEPDEATRKEAYRRVVEIVQEEAPIIAIDNQLQQYWVRANVYGMTPLPTMEIRFEPVYIGE